MGAWTKRREIRVTALIGPGPNAIHDLYRFAPDQEWQEAAVAQMFRRSNGQDHYLGDWHTHPSHTPIPSAKDRRVARLIARHGPARAPRPVLLIVGCWDDGRSESAVFVQTWRLCEATLRRTDRPTTFHF